MLKGSLSAAVDPRTSPELVVVPAELIRQPAKVARPALAFSGLVVQVRIAPAVPVPGTIERVIGEELPGADVLRFPPASWTSTRGCVVNAVFGAPPEGWVKKASLAADPSVMLKVLLVADVESRAAGHQRVAGPDLVDRQVGEGGHAVDRGLRQSAAQRPAAGVGPDGQRDRC